MADPARRAARPAGRGPQLFDDAVEEFLRYATIDQFGRRRVGIADIDVGGADRLNVTRDARAHVAIIDRIHCCPDQAVAPIELHVAIRTILERTPRSASRCSSRRSHSRTTGRAPECTRCRSPASPAASGPRNGRPGLRAMRVIID
jgi:hypothetical protein